MQKILISAFACKPSAGSEWGVGWNFFIRLQKHYDLYLITEGQFKEEIIMECKELGIDHSKIYFIDLDQAARRRFVNQGNWLFYVNYRIWQLKALRLAMNLNEKFRFDLVHHLNMIGFREPGDMWKLDIPFVVGPLGGFGDVPDSYFRSSYSKLRLKNRIKIFLNYLSLKLPYVKKAIMNADSVISAYPEARTALQQKFKKRSILIPETGCLEFQAITLERKNLIWVGKNVHRKQFGLACEAFLNSDLSKSESLIVVGEFSEKEKSKWSKDKNIIFRGVLPRDEVLYAMSCARALLFTSVHEGNPHVIFESMTVNTPVVCHDCFGMGNLIDESVGIKFPRKDYNTSLLQFTQSINKIPFIHFSRNAFNKKVAEHSWERRVDKIREVYADVTSK